MQHTNIVVLDNGASTIKAGVLVDEDELRYEDAQRPRLVPNAVVRSKGDRTTYFGHELARCRDFAGLHYRLPFEKGFLIDWDAQKAVWDGTFSPEVLNTDTADSSLLITEPYFNLPNLQDVYDQFVFEEYEFRAYYRCTPASLIPHGELFSIPDAPTPECVLVVDSGFSFTHAVPIMQGQVVWSAVKRLDVGGKLLTNTLKEQLSFRQWNMMDETHVVNHVKETCCYVARDFARDLEACRANPKNPIVQEYVLPDFTQRRAGYVRPRREDGSSSSGATAGTAAAVTAATTAETEQVLVMGNERFTVPEVLFRPDDIGLSQTGVAGTIAAAIACLPVDLRGMFWAHIGLVGGNARIPGFRDRLMTELRALAPVECEVVLYESTDPITEAYRSALALARSPEFMTERMVTRAEYLEHGSGICRRRFDTNGRK